MKVLILGASGMLGSQLLRSFSARKEMDVFVTVRNKDSAEALSGLTRCKNIYEADAGQFDTVSSVLHSVHPDIVINCIGVIKQLDEAKDPLPCIEINALFPHLLAKVCADIGARLIHISTDCVFSGQGGMYKESDSPDCSDLYGRTKLLGEMNYPHTLTLRTSIVGHELNSSVSLVDWFLSQEGAVNGFVNAIYSGFPTVEIARIIADYVIPNPELFGLFHVSSEPISKYELLRLIANEYGKKIVINPHEDFYCDRSLDSSRFRKAVGYVPPTWLKLVKQMREEMLLRC